MKRITFVFMFLILSVFVSCGMKNQVSEDEVLVNEIISESAKTLKKEANLYLIGEGASMMEEIQRIQLDFNYNKNCTIDEARKLLVLASETILNTINENEKVRKYLFKYPFPIEGVLVRISFIENNDIPKPPKLSLASVLKGRVRYFTTNEDMALSPMRSESYEEAYNIVKGKQLDPKKAN